MADAAAGGHAPAPAAPVEDAALALKFVKKCGIDIEALRDDNFFEVMTEIVGDAIDATLAADDAIDATLAADDAPKAIEGVGARKSLGQTFSGWSSTLYRIVGDRKATPCALEFVEAFESETAAAMELLKLIAPESTAKYTKQLFWIRYHEGKYVYPYKRIDKIDSRWRCLGAREEHIKTDAFYVVVIDDHADAKGKRPKFPWGTLFVKA